MDDKVSLSVNQEFTLSDISSVIGTSPSGSVISFSGSEGTWQCNGQNFYLINIKLKDSSNNILAEGIVNLNLNLIGTLNLSIELTQETELVQGSGIDVYVSYKGHILDANVPQPINPELVGTHLSQGLLNSDITDVESYRDSTTSMNFMNPASSIFTKVNSDPSFNEIRLESDTAGVYSKIKDLSGVKINTQFNRRFWYYTIDEVLAILAQNQYVGSETPYFEKYKYRVRIASDENIGLFKYLIVSEEYVNRILLWHVVEGKVRIRIYYFNDKKFSNDSKFLPNVMTHFDNIMVQSGSSVIAMQVTTTSRAMTGQTYQCDTYEGNEFELSNTLISQSSDIGHCVFDTGSHQFAPVVCRNPFDNLREIPIDELRNNVNYRFGENWSHNNVANKDEFNYDVPINFYYDFLSFSAPIINSRIVSQFNCLEFIIKYENIPFSGNIQLFDELVLYIHNDKLHCIIYSDYPQIIDYSNTQSTEYTSDLFGIRQFDLKSECESIPLDIEDINYIQANALEIIICYLKDNSRYYRRINLTTNVDEFILEPNLKYREIQMLR